MQGAQEYKTCVRCGATKPLSDFVFETKAGKYLNYCRECNKAYHAEYYKNRKAKSFDQPIVQDKSITKKCIKCGLTKSLDDFTFDKVSGKYVNTCKACKAKISKANYSENRVARLEQNKKYRLINKEKIDSYSEKYRIEHAEERSEYSRLYYDTHKETIKIKSKLYRDSHKEEIAERDKRYALEHKDSIAQKNKEWAAKHATELAEYSKKYRSDNFEELKRKRQAYDKKNRSRITKYYLNKRKIDPLFKLSTQVRGLIRISLKKNGYKKSSHTYEILGCDYETLWTHLKNTWLKNYGQEWNGEEYHIDHIIPLATAKTEPEVVDLCYYKNLQMLKPKDNLVKNKSLEWQLDDKRN